MIRKAGRGNLARLCVQLEFLILLNQYYLFVDFVEVCKINVFYNAVNTSLETVLKLSIFLLVLSCANLLVAICIFVLSAKLLIYCDKSIAILFVCCTIGVLDRTVGVDDEVISANISYLILIIISCK